MEALNAYNRRINLLLEEIEAIYHEAALRFGLSDSVMLILYTACLGGGCCQLSDITLWASKQTINSALRKLEADGIVCLERADGRKKLVRLTDKGALLAQNTVQRWIQAENAVTDQWSEAEKEIYIALTQRYLNGVKQKVREF